VDLIGGDTSTSQKGLIISVTAIGEVDPGQYLTRAGARVGDLIVVSGNLGGAYFGLQLLEREKRIFLENPQVKPDLEDRQYVLRRILRPEARQDVVDWLRMEQIQPTAMIDISDGLSSEILHLCRQSGVGARIWEDRIPFHAETLELSQHFGVAALTAALNGGEDYELLFTLAPEHKERIEAHGDLQVIGEVREVDHGAQLETRSGGVHPLVAQG